MKYVIIRDDDISYFAKPETLTKLYGPLFEQKNQSTSQQFPRQRANTKIGSRSPYRTREKLEYDPNVPPRFRGLNENFPLNENKEIVEFIRSLENYEVLQHGLTYGLINGVHEFSINDKEEIQHRANLGSALLEECFHSKTSFFVPPFNNASLETINFFKSH